VQSGTPAKVRAALLGVFLGALVVCDPLITTYLLRDYNSLIPFRDLPYLISITTAVIVGAWFVVRVWAPDLVTTMIRDYPRYFAFLYLLGYQLTSFKAGPVDPVLIVIAVFGFLFVAAMFIHGEDQRFVSTPLNMLNLALAICIVLTLAVEFKLFGFLKSLKPFVVFILLVNFLSRQDLTLTFLRWLIIFAMISATFGFVQEIAWLGFQQTLSIIPQASLKRMFETHWGIPVFRIPALMIAYRSLALYLATALILAIAALLWPTEKPLLPRRWLWTAVVVLLAGVGLTIAKDMLIGLAAAFFLLLILHRPRRIFPAAVAGLGGVVGLLVVVAVMPGNIDTALQVADDIPKSEQERIRLDRDSIEGVIHGPYAWLGRGVGVGARYTAHPLRWPAHNAFILVTAELGVVGLIIYLLIFSWVWFRAITLNIRVRDGPYLPVVRGLLGVLLVQLVGAQFEATYLDSFVWAIFAMLEAIGFQLRNYVPAPDAQRAPAVTAV
jgi:hypothetical protein